MAVEIHYVNVVLVKVDAAGQIIPKNTTATLDEVRRFRSTEHRIEPRTTGPCSTPSSANYPDTPTYLAAEAALGFALAYMDQYHIVTQKIT